MAERLARQYLAEGEAAHMPVVTAAARSARPSHGLGLGDSIVRLWLALRWAGPAEELR